MSAGLRFCSKMLQQRIGKILVDHGQGRSHLLSQDVSELFLASELKVRDLIVSTHVPEHFLCVVRRFFRYDHQSGFSGLYRLLCGELATSYLAGFLRQAQQAQEQQEALRMELVQLRYAIGQGGDAASAARVDEEILQALVALRSSAALNDYSSLEDQVLEVKSSVLRREYAYGADLSAVDLAARLTEMTAQYEALRAQNYDAVTRITAPVSGTFSALVDGYETLIDPDTALQLTPEGLSGLMKQPPEADRTAAGKLITSNQWQFAALVTQEEGERLARESGVTLRFASDFTQDIPMEVVRVGEPENGQAVVVLSTDHCLEQTTLLRRQTAELIFDSRSGLRVPKGAVRMIDGTRTDEETGEITQYSTLGVYVVTAGRAEFKPVEILAEGDEFYVVRSVNQDRKALRAGDEVVIRGTGLYDGKLLEF